MQRLESSGSDKTSLHRLERWNDAGTTLKKYPFLGVGFEAWAEYYPTHFTPEYKGSTLVHNIFIQCAVELGYIGLMVFLAMIIVCFYLTFKSRRKLKGGSDNFLYILSYGFDSALIGFLVSGSFVTVLYYPYFWIHCALTTCLHTAAIKKAEGYESN